MGNNCFAPRANFPRRVDVIHSRYQFLEALKKAIKRYPEYQEIFKLIKQNANRHYVGFSLDNPLKVSFSKGCHRHDYKRRTRTTLGRYIKRHFDFQGTDNELDHFTRTILAHQNVQFRFSILQGEAIREAYEQEIGGHSCMTGDEANGKLDIYVENSNIKLLVYHDESIRARALVWKCDDGSTCLDRIYPNDGYHIPLFEEYAKQNGWLVRPHNKLPSDDINYDGPKQITIDGPDSGEFPYLDSFRFTNDNPNFHPITLQTNNGSYLFDDTNGSWSDGLTCEHCNCSVSEDDEMTHNDCVYCSDCFYELFTDCEYCEETVDREDTTTVDGQTWCDGCAQNHAAYCEKCGDYSQESQEVDGNTWCKSCAEHYATLCEKCNNYSQETQEVDGEDWCSDCVERHATECDECGDYFPTNETETIDDKEYCECCAGEVLAHV